MGVRTSGENGDSDPILPHYMTRVKDAYLKGVRDGFSRPVVVILDPLYEPCQKIIEDAWGPPAAAECRSIARGDDIPSMLVVGWRDDSARHFLRGQPGASEIIDAIYGAGADFPVFIFDGDGPRWFNFPIPSGV